MENEYLLRRDHGSKVVLEKVPHPKTLDENSIPKNLQEHVEAPRRSIRVPNQPNQHVGDIVTNDFDRNREATYLLGIRIYSDRLRRFLELSQSIYIDTNVKRFGMKNSKKIFKNQSIHISISREIKEIIKIENFIAKRKKLTKFFKIKLI